MNEFVASNGVIVREHPGSIGVRRSVEDLAPVAVPGFAKPERVETYLDPRQWDAIAEAVQAEADERLGRWRWPENPDYVVYPVGDDTVDVLRESSVSEKTRGPGRQESITRADAAAWDSDAARNFFRAARAYFDAHPEPKPEWHAAKTDEVWVLTFDSDGGGGTSPWVVDRNGEFASPVYANTVSRHDPHITHGRPIWKPESES